MKCRQWGIGVWVGILVLVTLMLAYSSDPAARQGALPELPNIPAPMESPILDPAIQWDHRFHFQGIITDFGNNTISVKNRTFKKAQSVRYFDGVGHPIYFSSLRHGLRVGLILGPSLEIREVWKIPEF